MLERPVSAPCETMLSVPRGIVLVGGAGSARPSEARNGKSWAGRFAWTTGIPCGSHSSIHGVERKWLVHQHDAAVLEVSTQVTLLQVRSTACAHSDHLSRDCLGSAALQQIRLKGGADTHDETVQQAQRDRLFDDGEGGHLTRDGLEMATQPNELAVA